MGIDILQAIGLILAGLLAGEEFIVRWGVQPALSTLEDRAHILARVALVKRLKVVVPILMVPTGLVGIAVLATGGAGAGFGFRVVGLLALVAFVLFSFLGTVPINIRVNEWTPDAPPADWRDIVRRWQFIDVFRSSAAIAAFVAFVVAAALRF
jgi:uncharacterized membrane protein